MFRPLVCALGLVSFGLFMLGCSILPTPPPPAPPSVTIDSPNTGSIFLVGEEVIIQATITDDTGISRVTLSMDGAIVRQEQPDNVAGVYETSLSWTASRPGSRTLVVRAINSAGRSGDASVQILVEASDDASNSDAIATIAPFVFQTPDAAATKVPTELPTNTPEAATPVPAAANCIDNARFVADLTIPDGTRFTQNAQFEKSWELENNGTCAWDNYTVAFIGGQRMGAQNSYAVPLTQPGESAAIVIPLTAPGAYGVHKGIWQLQNLEGVLFGSSFTVVINVPSPVVATAVPTVVNKTNTPPATVLLPTNTPTGQPCKGTPKDFSFTASDTDIAAGDQVTLTWGAVTNATYVTLDGGIYNQEGVEAPGTRNVKPTETTTYMLKAVCENGGAVHDKSVTIVVNGVQPKTATPTNTPEGSCSGTPGIGSFSVNKDSVDAGEKVTLSWSGVTNADDIKLFSGSDVDTVGPSGQVKRTVEETTTYRLQALCNAAGTSNEQEVTVTVNP